MFLWDWTAVELGGTKCSSTDPYPPQYKIDVNSSYTSVFAKWQEADKITKCMFTTDTISSPKQLGSKVTWVTTHPDPSTGYSAVSATKATINKGPRNKTDAGLFNCSICASTFFFAAVLIFYLIYKIKLYLSDICIGNKRANAKLRFQAPTGDLGCIQRVAPGSWYPIDTVDGICLLFFSDGSFSTKHSWDLLDDSKPTLSMSLNSTSSFGKSTAYILTAK